MVNIYICSNYTVHKQITVNTYGHVYDVQLLMPILNSLFI